MVITIDGPAGAGKSTIATSLAQKLGYRVLDTGAMYRAITWLAMYNKIPWDDIASLERLAAGANLVLDDGRVVVNGHDVSDEIRSREVTKNVRFVADQPEVRQQLVKQQRAICASGNYVTEGRDQGTDAFPHAELKFYLTASPEARALRRQHQLAEQGIDAIFEELLKEQEDRDRRDQTRPVGALRIPDDAIEVDTDRLSIDEVVDMLCGHAEQYKRSHADFSADSSSLETRTSGD